MSILSRLFGRKPPPAAPAPLPIVEPRPERVDVHRGAELAANNDVIAGWQFCATMQLRTPLRVLSRHGETQDGRSGEPPVIAREQWEGIWVPKTRTFRELGIDLDEMLLGTMASDIGQVPADGGEYLRFLVAVREAAEGAGTVQERRKAVGAILSDPAWRKWVRAHEGKGAILDDLFPPFIAVVPRMSDKLAKAIIAAGFATPAKIAAATDLQLRAVEGVGPATVKALRDAADGAEDKGARYVDRVIR